MNKEDFFPSLRLRDKEEGLMNPEDLKEVLKGFTIAHGGTVIGG